MPESTTISLASFDGSFRRVALPMGLVVDELKLGAGAATIGVNPFSLRFEKEAPLEAHIAALDLAAFLDSKAPGGLKDFAMSIRDGLIFVEATARVIVEMRAKVTCTLRIEDKTKLYVDLESVDVLGFGGAKGMVQGQLDQINPVLDTSELPLRITLESTTLQNDRLTLRGFAHSIESKPESE